MPVNNGGIASIWKKWSKWTESCYFKGDTKKYEEFWVTETWANLYFNWDQYKWDNWTDSKWNKCFPNQSKCLNWDKEYYISNEGAWEECQHGQKCNGNYGNWSGWFRNYYYSSNEWYLRDYPCKECIINNSGDALWTVWANGYYLDRIANKWKLCNPSWIKWIDYNKWIAWGAGFKLTQDMNWDWMNGNEYFNGTNWVKWNIEWNGWMKSGGNWIIKLSNGIIYL